MTIKNEKTEVSFNVEELRHFSIDTAEKMQDFIKTVQCEEKTTGFKHLKDMNLRS